MASYITLNGNETRLSGKLRNLVDTATSLQDQMNRMKSYMDECGAANAEWANVGLKLGVSTADALDTFVNRLG